MARTTLVIRYLGDSAAHALNVTVSGGRQISKIFAPGDEFDITDICTLDELNQSTQWAYVRDAGLFEVADALADAQIEVEALQAETLALRFSINALEQSIRSLGTALDGLIELVVTSDELDITADELNEGAAGTVTRTVQVRLRTPPVSGRPFGTLHEWSNVVPAITVGGTAADGDIGDLTFNDPYNRFVEGLLNLVVTFDTDEGATKTYQADDTRTLTVDISAVSPLFADVDPLTIIWTVE